MQTDEVEFCPLYATRSGEPSIQAKFTRLQAQDCCELSHGSNREGTST